MKKSIIFMIAAATAFFSVETLTAQKISLTNEDVKKIFEEYKDSYPDGLSIYAFMDDKPTFKGGGLENLKTRITTRLDNNTVIPGSASVYVFVVDKKGKVQNLQVTGPNEKQNELVRKAIKGTKWKPGTSDGKPVDVLVISGISLHE